MALYSRADLAKHVGKARAQITTAVKAGRLVMDEDNPDMLDDKHPVNKTTIGLWLAKRKSKSESVVAVPSSAKKTNRTTAKKKAQKTKGATVTSTGGDTLGDKKLKAETERIKSTTELNKLRSAKLRGEALPIPLVKGIVHTLGVNFQQFYKNGADQLLMQFNHKHKLPPAAVTALGGALYDLINQSHKKAISASKKEIENLISDVASNIANSNNIPTE